MPDRLLVTLCTYNERENLLHMVPAIHAHAPDADILVVDDNSPDGTGPCVDELAANDSRIHAIHRPGKLGLGTATVAALRFAIDHEYDLVLNMDADFSHPPETIPQLRAAAESADVAIGSRYIPGGGVAGWGPLRHFMSRSINLYARCILGLKTKDNSGSFRCYRVAKLQEIDWSRVRSTGYAIQEELLYRCRRIGCSFTEVPFTFVDRVVGESKISLRDGFRTLWVLLLIRLRG